MTEKPDLEALYQNAYAALKAKDYDRASGLLRQILIVDEEYKDAARLLAQMVRQQRRRWYNDPRLYAAFGFAAVILLVIWLAPRLRSIYAAPVPTANTAMPFTIIPPTLTAAMTATLEFPPTSTPVPLTWKRLSLGQEFQRDTITAIETDSSDMDVIYAGTQDSGIFKSIDGGISWQSAYQGVTNAQVHTLIADPRDPRILFAGTGDGIYKTIDGGTSWSFLIRGGSYFIDPQNSSHRYVLDSNRNLLFETVDNGHTWTEISGNGCPEPQYFGFFAMHPFKSNTLFTSELNADPNCKAGLYQSNDAGHTWVLTGLEEKQLMGFGIAKDANGNDVLFVDNQAGDSTGGLYVSRNEGLTWERTNPPGGSEIIAFDRDFPNAIYLGANGITVTKDAGRSWSQLASLDISNLSVIHVDHPRGATRIIAGGSGIDISTDNGATWLNRSNGLGAVRLDMKIDPADNSVVYVATYPYSYERSCALFRSLDSGRNWKKLPLSPNSNWCGPAFDLKGNLFAYQDGGKLMRSADHGSTWTEMPLPAEQKNIVGIGVNPYLTGHIYSLSDTPPQIYSSSDSGSSWEASSGLNNTTEGGWQSSRLFFAKPEGKLLYAIGPSILHRSSDGGKTWQPCTVIGFVAESDSRMVIDPDYGNHLFVATQGGAIYESTDNGDTWTSKNIGINQFINTLAIDPNRSNIIYAGSSDGAYVSFDGSDTWNQINHGLVGATVVYSIVMDIHGNVYAATPNGIFQLEHK